MQKAKELPEIRVEVERLAEDQYRSRVFRGAKEEEICSNTFRYEPGLLVDIEPQWMLERARAHEGWEAARKATAERLLTSPEERLARYGGRLFGFLFGDGEDFKAFLRFNDAYRFGARLNLCIHPDAAALWELPWEYLHDGEGFLALDGRFLLSRIPWGLGELRPPRKPLPLRILVVISSPTDQAELNTEKEVAVLQEALDEPVRKGLVVLHFLDDATLEAIEGQLLRVGYHVVHYTGHGAYDEATGRSYLALEDDEGRTRRAGAEELAPLFRRLRAQGKAPQLVVLSGCQTARTSRLDAFGGVATGLLKAEVPAVVAMQFSILDPSAIEFAGAFYGALAQGLTPAQAMLEARLALRRRKGGPGYDWGVPALYLRAQGMRLIDPEAKPERVAVFERVDVGGLPVPLLFVGRKPELRRARRALRDSRINALYIRGIGGIGKSTLAAKFLERPGTEVDGRLVVRCDELPLPVDVVEKVAVFLAAQGVEGHAEAAQILRDSRLPMEERARRAAALVSHRRYVIVFDAFESLMEPAEGDRWEVADEEVRGFFRGLLDAQWRSTCVFTSRYRWKTLEDYVGRGTAEEIPLPGLTERQALMLMAELPHLKDEPLEDKISAYEKVGGHPKTIELLNAWLAEGGRSLKELLSDPRLDFRLAEEWERYFLADLMERLSPEEREALTRCAIFRGMLTSNHLSYAGVKEGWLKHWLDLSILHREGKAYTMHQVVREYLLNRLSGEEQERLHLWAADFYARPFVEMARMAVKAAGETLPEEAIATLARLDKGVLGRIVGQTKDMAAAQAAMAAALEWHHHLFHARRYKEAGEIVNAIYDVLDRQGQRDAAKGLLWMSIETLEGFDKAVVQGNLATLLKNEGKLDEALATYEKVYRTFEAEGAKQQMAATLAQMASVYMDKGEYDRAIENYEKALDIFREIGDEEGQAIGLHQLSRLYHLKGDEAAHRGQQQAANNFYQQALRLSQETEEKFRKLGIDAHVAATLHQQGLILVRLNRPAKAWERFRESLKISRRIEDGAGTADTLAEMGKLLMAAGRMDEAITAFKEALEIYRRLGLWPKVALSLETLGAVHELQGEYAPALEKYKEALRLAKQYYPAAVPTLEQHIERVRKKMRGHRSK